MYRNRTLRDFTFFVFFGSGKFVIPSTSVEASHYYNTNYKHLNGAEREYLLGNTLGPWVGFLHIHTPFHRRRVA